MKMGDYFSLPVRADSCYRVVCDDGIIIAEDTVSNEEISHAINMHDELVEALEFMLCQFDADECFVNEADNQAVSQARKAIEKAKS